MTGAHYRLFEITRSVKGDPLGKVLMDEVLTTCFDHVLGNEGALQRLVIALDRFNHYLTGYSQPIASGLFRGNSEQVSAWAQMLTREILADREQGPADDCSAPPVRGTFSSPFAKGRGFEMAAKSKTA
jgi:hypothetical protein